MKVKKWFFGFLTGMLFLLSGILYAQNYPDDSTRTDTSAIPQFKPDTTKIDTSHIDMRSDTLIYNSNTGNNSCRFSKYENLQIRYLSFNNEFLNVIESKIPHKSKFRSS